MAIKPIPPTKYYTEVKGLPKVKDTSKRKSSLVLAVEQQTQVLKGMHKTLEGLTLTLMQMARIMQEDYDSYDS